MKFTTFYVLIHFRTFIKASKGRGKGCGIFSLSSRKLSHETTVIQENYQLMSVVDETVLENAYQLITVYLSSGCDLYQVVDNLSSLLVPNMKTIITGDFNFDRNKTNSLTKFLKDKMFVQNVSWPTHIQGKTLDQCWTNVSVQLTRHSVYYSDHDALCIELTQQLT